MESRQLIEPKDVIAVQFECGKCGARISFQLSDKSEYAKPRPLIECPVCNQDWDIASGSQEHDAVRQFIDGLSRISPALRGRALRLAMEIAGEEP